MIPFLITIEGIAPDEDTMHEMFANVRPDRNKIVEGLSKAGATQITARSTHARRKKVEAVATGGPLVINVAEVTDVAATPVPDMAKLSTPRGDHKAA
jgi:hypothetical protein